MTLIESWTEQLKKSALGMEEMQRIKKTGNKRMAQQSEAWSKRYFKGYLIDAVVAILKETGITPDEVKDRYDDFGDCDRRIMTLN